MAAAAQLGELLAALRRTGRGLAMTLRDRGDLGDLLEGLGQLVLRQLDGATSAQVSRCARRRGNLAYLALGWFRPDFLM